MSNTQQIAVHVPVDLYEEIQHLTDSQKDSFFYDVLRRHVEQKKAQDLRFQMKQGYMEMAQINLEIAEDFCSCECEALQLTEGVYAGGR
ncbi:CopG family transcriptional regulator/antitoxin EndoAI [Salsuginibacillus halophilus]|uniref:CopG family transcriptional regulator/antitoxin EndoAI n=1 Tax=Salsuginibacillus halophilus TaxID=517424 RepID=A0A2P8HWI7_9BACI|nr:hypothetical protein [Salsuginibacillus halophilus]PSL50587.1 CopG family transcriptional regulator/antitoxin EndoAI [Salsuginibacillus halophilus]